MAMQYKGIYLPVITPFLNNKVDYYSYEKLIVHYLEKGIHGIIPLGTTGESPTVSNEEYHKILEITIKTVGSKIPIFLGLGGNDTSSLVTKIRSFENYEIEGYLIAAPYYNRPSQAGILRHYQEIAKSTGKKIMIYNIPYRTGVNIENTTIRKIAEIKNVTGLKDSCGFIGQTLDMLNDHPDDFSVFTGEDILTLTNLSHGGAGGILASCHVHTEKFVSIYESLKKDEPAKALKIWNEIYPVIPLLFKEPNPGPVKYILFKEKLIQSDELRLPLVGISEQLKGELSAISGL
jgi:4-hydroxy-tetrahydrodipicolinate synthase